MPFRAPRRIAFAVASASAVAVMAPATAARAHPRLVTAMPAADSTIGSTRAIKLTFNETLVARFSGMSVLMTDRPGGKMTAPLSAGPVTSTVAADGKTLVGTLPAVLRTGTYTLGWHAVTADTHRVEGSYSFTVK